MERINFVFWQTTHSEQHAPLIAELASNPEYKVNVVLMNQGYSDRTAQPSNSLNFGSSEVRTAPDRTSVLELAKLPVEGTVHLVSGLENIIWDNKAVTDFWKRSGSRVLLIGKAWDEDGINGRRRTRAFRKSARVNRSLIDGVIATGKESVIQFQKLGFLKVFPFINFISVDKPNSANFSRLKNLNSQFVYVAKNNDLSNIRNIIRIFSSMPSEARLSVLVSKTKDSEVFEICASDQSGKVLAADSDDLARAQVVLEEADVLIILNTTEVSDALMKKALSGGSAVLLSDACEEAEIIDSTRGSILSNGVGTDLLKRIETLHYTVMEAGFDRFSIADWSYKHISSAAGADYLIQILSYLESSKEPRPSEPWISATKIRLRHLI